jgi:hypothetical protein
MLYDISTTVGLKCAPVAEYKLPINIPKTRASEILKKVL